jgi:hypothetical protein
VAGYAALAEQAFALVTLWWLACRASMALRVLFEE